MICCCLLTACLCVSYVDHLISFSQKPFKAHQHLPHLKIEMSIVPGMAKLITVASGSFPGVLMWLYFHACFSCKSRCIHYVYVQVKLTFNYMEF